MAEKKKTKIKTCGTCVYRRLKTSEEPCKDCEKHSAWVSNDPADEIKKKRREK